MAQSRWLYRTTSSSLLFSRCAFQSQILSFALERWTGNKWGLEAHHTSAGCQNRNTQIGAPGALRWDPYFGSSSTDSVGACLPGFVTLYFRRSSTLNLPLTSQRIVAKLQAEIRGPDLAGTRYCVVRHLARGGMGSVWLADDAVLNRRVAP